MKELKEIKKDSSTLVINTTTSTIICKLLMCNPFEAKDEVVFSVHILLHHWKLVFLYCSFNKST